MESLDAYAARYTEMSDGELAELISDGLESLNEEARHAFGLELRKRGLSTARLEEEYPRAEEAKEPEARSKDGYLHALWFALKELRRERKASGWPVVTGRVQNAFRTRAVYKGVIRAEIAYQYSVNSKEYAGRTVRDFVGYTSAELMVNRYGVGDKVEVRFDPNDPSKSYLPSRIGYWGSIVIGTFGVLIWGLVAFIVIGLLVQKHRAH